MRSLSISDDAKPVERSIKATLAIALSLKQNGIWIWDIAKTQEENPQATETIKELVVPEE